MATRTRKPQPPPAKATKASARASSTTMEQRLVSLAELLGTTVGTIQGKAGVWMDGAKLRKQIANVRDSATHLLDQLSRTQKSAATSTKPSARQARPARSGGAVDAPGKKHRKPPASDPGAKKADGRAPVARTTRAVRAGTNRRG